MIKEPCLHRAEETLSSNPMWDNLNQLSFQWRKAEFAWVVLGLLLCTQRLCTSQMLWISLFLVLCNSLCMQVSSSHESEDGFGMNAPFCPWESIKKNPFYLPWMVLSLGCVWGGFSPCKPSTLTAFEHWMERGCVLQEGKRRAAWPAVLPDPRQDANFRASEVGRQISQGTNSIQPHWRNSREENTSLLLHSSFFSSKVPNQAALWGTEVADVVLQCSSKS